MPGAEFKKSKCRTEHVSGDHLNSCGSFMQALMGAFDGDGRCICCKVVARPFLSNFGGITWQNNRLLHHCLSTPARQLLWQKFGSWRRACFRALGPWRFEKGQEGRKRREKKPPTRKPFYYYFPSYIRIFDGEERKWVGVWVGARGRGMSGEERTKKEEVFVILLW